MQPSKPRPGNNGRFLLGVLLAFLASACLVAFLNWWQNPFFAFPQVLPHIRERAPGAILNADRDRQLRWLIHQGNSSDSATLVIGASQFLYGMDTCTHPEAQRLALFVFSDDEIEQLLQGIVHGRHRQTTFYISRGLAVEHPHPVPVTHFQALRRDLLGQQTTEASLKDLVGSLLPGSPPCGPVPYTIGKPDSLSPRMLKREMTYLGAHLAPPESLDRILRTIEPACAAQQHRIVILHMPILFLPEETPLVLAMDERLSDPARDVIAAFNQRNTGCTAELRDLAQPFIVANQVHGARQDEWFDTLHFRPPLGRVLLDDILSGSNAGLQRSAP